MLLKTNGVWKQCLPMIKRNGVWVNYEETYLKQNGLYKPTKLPWVTNGHLVTLALHPYNDGVRRAFIKSGDGIPGSLNMGALNKPSVTINGQVYKIRGVEMGPDMTNWTYVSIQLLGSPPIDKMRKIAFLGDVGGIYVSHSWNAGVQCTFISYKFPGSYIPPVSTPLKLRF